MWKIREEKFFKEFKRPCTDRLESYTYVYKREKKNYSKKISHELVREEEKKKKTITTRQTITDKTRMTKLVNLEERARRPASALVIR